MTDTNAIKEKDTEQKPEIKIEAVKVPTPYSTDNQDEILLLMALKFSPTGTGSNDGRLSYTFSGTSDVLGTLKKFELQGAAAFEVNFQEVLSALANWKRALARMRAGNSALS